MFKVNSSQFNYQYRGRIHFPYSIGMLVAYVKGKPELSKEFNFEKTFVFRDKADEYIEQCKDSDILLCSCYVWNWEITTKLVKEVKKINPKCLVVFGGPQVPNNTEGFFEKYPFVDILVHGEGEYVLGNILEAYLKGKDFSEVLGIETKDSKNPIQPRINDFGDLPSPYLTNLIWDLVETSPKIQWIAAWETLRGCPYACTFCDWGSAIATKMRKFEEEKIMQEIEWFGENKIPYIDCCDANFGIYQDRDMRIAKKMNEVSKEMGYPKTFHPTFAKVSSEKIIPIAKELYDSGLLRAVTLSLQSLDPATLKIIKRANIKFDKFSELTESFRNAGLPTYTEIIRGLPGETLENFKKGLEVIVSDTKVDHLLIHNCGVFPNAPMAEPTYVEQHKIKTIRSPIFLWHSDVTNRGIPEYEEIAIGAFSYTLEDLKEMFLYSWLMVVFQNMGILEFISKFYQKTHNLTFINFYDIFIDFCKTEKTIFSEQYEIVSKYIEDGYSGKGWNFHDPDLGEIYWPIDEAAWAKLAWDENKLKEDMLLFVNYLESKKDYKNKTELIQDLVKWNVFLLTTRDNDNSIKTETFKFAWKHYFSNDSQLQESDKIYSYENKIIATDGKTWSWETIFVGRWETKFKIYPLLLQEVEQMTQLV